MTKKNTQNGPTKNSLAQELDPDKLTLSKKDILEFIDVILYRWKKNYLVNAKYIAGLEMMKLGLFMTGEDTLSKIWSEILNGFNDLLYENAMALARSESPDWDTIREKIKKKMMVEDWQPSNT